MIVGCCRWCGKEEKTDASRACVHPRTRDHHVGSFPESTGVSGPLSCVGGPEVPMLFAPVVPDSVDAEGKEVAFCIRPVGLDSHVPPTD